MESVRKHLVVMAGLAASLLFVAQAAASGHPGDLVREVLRQQSSAERSGCTGIRTALTAGTDASLVVRTAVELGYNSCQVIRCALGVDTDRDRESLCENVVRGAASAGVQADVISRCAVEACDRAAVASLLADVFLEPNYCYFALRPLVAPDALPLLQPVIDRKLPSAEASPFTF